MCAQARLKGEELLQQALRGSEEFDMSSVLLAVDQFKQAELLTREVDVENEAIALSRLGSGECRSNRLSRLGLPRRLHPPVPTRFGHFQAVLQL